jgi:hypothetical protein
MSKLSVVVSSYDEAVMHELGVIEAEPELVVWIEYKEFRISMPVKVYYNAKNEEKARVGSIKIIEYIELQGANEYRDMNKVDTASIKAILEQFREKKQAIVEAFEKEMKRHILQGIHEQLYDAIEQRLIEYIE